MVDCTCDPGLYRPVLLDPWLLAAGVHACLGCGTVTVTEVRGDDGRYTGEPSRAYFKLPVPGEALAWIAQWPRARFTWLDARWPMAAELVRREVVYLPRDTRCASVAELQQLEAQSAAYRLRDLATPTTAPPASLPAMFRGFADIWEALQLTPDSDRQRLVYLAQLRNEASAVAAEVAVQRADFPELLVEALRRRDPVWLSAGIAMARVRPVPQLADVLIEELAQLSLAPLPDVPGRIVDCGRAEALLVLIADLKLNPPGIIAALHELRRRLARYDALLVEHAGLVLKEL